MNKIATPVQLEAELRRLLKYVQSAGPSRAVVASELRSLSEGLAAVKLASTKQFDQYIQLAADGIESLRKSDVYRVLEQAKAYKELTELAAYITKKNPSLKSTVTGDVDDLIAEKGWTKTARNAQLEKAVELAQLYAGSSLGMNIRDAQKLYNRMTRACETIARQKNLDSTDVIQQVMAEATKRGPKQARPGKDY